MIGKRKPPGPYWRELLLLICCSWVSASKMFLLKFLRRNNNEQIRKLLSMLAWFRFGLKEWKILRVHIQILYFWFQILSTLQGIVEISSETLQIYVWSNKRNLSSSLLSFSGYLVLPMKVQRPAEFSPNPIDWTFLIMKTSAMTEILPHSLFPTL